MEELTATPGWENPVFVWSESAPPSAFSPNSGLEPGMKVTLAIAFIGMRSQFIVSPNGSLARTPS